MTSKRWAVGAAILLSMTASLVAGNWPAWRGPSGDGVCLEKNLPVKWSRTENVRWKANLPAPGNSTPVIWENRVFLTQANGTGRMLFCFERKDGHELWRNVVKDAGKEPTHEDNLYCGASPVTDGERVIAFFGSAGLHCYDVTGKELWSRDLGPQRHIWGYGASPVIHGDVCVLNFGPGERTFLIALDKRTGKTVWQHDEPGGDSGGKVGDAKPKWLGSWTTPLVIAENGRESLIMMYPQRVASFDLMTGRENWFCGGINELSYTSPLYSEAILVAMGGFNGKALAVRPGGQGNVTETHRIWHHPRTKQRIGSGVIHNGYIYVLNDPGVAECIELKTGKVVWEETVKGTASRKQNWSSLMLADGKLYAINQGGDCLVMMASPKFELLAVNPLGERSNSSIAPSNGELFIRTYQSLWCIAEKK